MIYAAEILGQKFIKIGSADRDVSLRIAELQIGNPFKIGLVMCVEGTLRQELSIHAALTTCFGRIRIPCPPNEWYPGRHPLMQHFLADLRISVSGALGYLSSYDPNVKQPGQKAGGHYEPVVRWPVPAKLGMVL